MTTRATEIKSCGVSPKGGCRFSRVLKCVGMVIAGVVVLIAGGLLFLTFWLTPERLSGIVSREASEYLTADVRLVNLRFTIWSTFPRFCIEADSLRVDSRVFDSLPPSLRKDVPEGSRRLLEAGSLSGGINLVRLASGQVKLHDVKVKGLDMNLVVLNDTIANYMIIPASGPKHNIPEISANSITLEDCRGIDFRSQSSGMKAHIALRKALLTRQSDTTARHERFSEYRCNLGGFLTLNGRETRLLNDFPVELDGDIFLAFNPLKVRFSDYKVSLGSIDSRVSLDLRDENSPELSALTLSIPSFRLVSLIEWLPEALIPDLRQIKSDVEMRGSARLTKPYSLTSDDLPSFRFDLSVADGVAEYRMPDGEDLDIRHIGLSGTLHFNGEVPDSSRLEIPRFRLECAGTRLDMSANVGNLFGSPYILSDVDFRSDLRALSKMIPGMGRLQPRGTLEGRGEVGFHLVSLSGPEVEQGDVELTLRAPRARIATEPGRSMLKVRGLGLALSGKWNYNKKGFHLASPAHYDLGLKDVEWQRDSTRMGLRDGHLKGMLTLATPTTLFDSLRSHLESREYWLATRRNRMTLRNLSAEVLFRRPTSDEKHTFQAPERVCYPDSAMLARTPHTPVYLTPGVIPGMIRFVRDWRMEADVMLADGEWDIKDYPHPFKFADVALSTDFDDLSIEHIGVSNGESSLEIDGKAAGFRNFFIYPGPSPLRVNMNLDCATVDINQIARACRDAAGVPESDGERDVASRKGEGEKGSAVDAWLIPRNVEARLHLSSDHLLYTNLDLSDVEGELGVRDGNLRVEDMKLKTGFGSAEIGAEYRSSDLGDLSVAANLNVRRMDLIPFYGKFRNTMEMMPQLKNLSGYVSVGGNVRLGIFPDMTVNMPSLEADLYLEGESLRLHQDPFIHKVARMMLITDNKDIDIADMKVEATVHDNLLELRPFTFGFDRWRIKMLGVNNFAGDLEYHIGVDRSPVPFAFGINVEGNYHHPKLRFGGSGWKADNALRVTGNISRTFFWNFVEKMQWAGRAFLDKAASGETL